MNVNSIGSATPAVSTDFERIMACLSILHGTALEVRDRSLAIRTPPGTEGKPDCIAPSDASGKLFNQIENIQDILNTALCSLKAFI